MALRILNDSWGWGLGRNMLDCQETSRDQLYLVGRTV
jgi:hypothetical protein